MIPPQYPEKVHRYFSVAMSARFRKKRAFRDLTGMSAIEKYRIGRANNVVCSRVSRLHSARTAFGTYHFERHMMLRGTGYELLYEDLVALLQFFVTRRLRQMRNPRIELRPDNMLLYAFLCRSNYFGWLVYQLAIRSVVGVRKTGF